MHMLIMDMSLCISLSGHTFLDFYDMHFWTYISVHTFLDVPFWTCLSGQTNLVNSFWFYITDHAFLTSPSQHTLLDMPFCAHISGQFFQSMHIGPAFLDIAFWNCRAHF